MEKRELVSGLDKIRLKVHSTPKLPVGSAKVSAFHERPAQLETRLGRSRVGLYRIPKLDDRFIQFRLPNVLLSILEVPLTFDFRTATIPIVCEHATA